MFITRPTFKRAALGVVASTLLAAASQAHAESSSTATYRLTATIPVACWVRPSTAVSAAPGAGGQVTEACNSPGGFTISASYRSLSVGERARLSYGDRVVDLAPNGFQELRRSSLATIQTVRYRFADVALDSPLILALTIQPI
jgi:hypothetical protein